MEKVGKFYAHFAYFTAKWYILWPFSADLVYFPRFGILCKKSGNPGVFPERQQ
jgi:hypothetical protein